MKTLLYKVGILQSEYSLIRHRDGSVTVRVPYVKWFDPNSNILFRKIYVESGPSADYIKSIFDNQGNIWELNDVLTKFM